MGKLKNKIQSRYINTVILQNTKKYVNLTLNNDYLESEKEFEILCGLLSDETFTNKDLLYTNLSTLTEIVEYLCRYKFDDNVEPFECELLDSIFDKKQHLLKTHKKFSYVISWYYQLHITNHNIDKANQYMELFWEYTDFNTGIYFLFRALTKASGTIDIKYLEDFASKHKLSTLDIIKIPNLYLDNLESLFLIKERCSVSYLEQHVVTISNTLSDIFNELDYVAKEKYLRICYLYNLENKEKLEKKIEETFGDYSNFQEMLEQKSNYKYLKKDPATYETSVFDLMHSRVIDKQEVQSRLLEECKKYKKEIKKSKKIKDLLSNVRIIVQLNVYVKYNGFFAKMDTELKKIKPATKKDTLLVYINEYSLVCNVNSFPLLMYAKKEGYDVLSPSLRTLTCPYDVKDKLFSLWGQLTYSRYLPEEITLIDYTNWNIDVKNKKIEFNGMNFYQPIYEMIVRYQFDFFLDCETDLFAKYKIGTYLLLIENTLKYIEKIKEYSLECKKEVYFVGFAPHFLPSAVYRIYCQSKNNTTNINFIVSAAGYDNYFNNIKDSKTSTIAYLNLTQNINSRSSFLGTKQKFDYYYKNEYENNKYSMNERAQQWIKLKRANNNRVYSEAQQSIINKIKEYKKINKSIFLLGGKVVFDLAVFDTKGTIHEDMSDFVTNTVNIMKKSDNLLIIKPHPHELNKELTMSNGIIRKFIDLIKTEIPDNVILLDNTDFNLFELLDYIDCGLFWNGTSSIELASMSIPTYVFDTWAFKDYPIGFPEVNSIKEYEEILVNSKITQKDISSKAIAFLNFMGSKYVCFPNKYSVTSSLNYQQFTKSKLFSDNISEYARNGCKELDEYVKDLFI
ncbi:MAG: hypothetical protein ACK5KQ_02905 [Anaerorhabdus sp.]